MTILSDYRLLENNVEAYEQKIISNLYTKTSYKMISTNLFSLILLIHNSSSFMLVSVVQRIFNMLS